MASPDRRVAPARDDASATAPTELWVADWSDPEDAAFRAAWAAEGLHVRVLRTRRPLGTSTGTPWHRIRSYPAYLSLGVRGRLRAKGAPIVAWQPLASVAAALMPAGRGGPLVALNPILHPQAQPVRHRVLLAALRRCDLTLFFSTGAADVGLDMGLSPERVGVVQQGVLARRDTAPPPGDFLVAVGKWMRDWATLAQAAEGLCEVLVVGPQRLPEGGPLRLVRTGSRLETLALLERAAGMVLPLSDPDVMAGHLSLLDAFSVGRGVVATRTVGMTDYVTPDRGILVPPGDPDALREGMRRMLEPETASRLGAGALRAAHTDLSLRRFVRRVHDLATRL